MGLRRPAMLWVMLAMSSGMVLDFPTNGACRVSAQRDLEWPQLSSVERLAHGRGVGWHEDEPDVGRRPPSPDGGPGTPD